MASAVILVLPGFGPTKSIHSPTMSFRIVSFEGRNGAVNSCFCGEAPSDVFERPQPTTSPAATRKTSFIASPFVQATRQQVASSPSSGAIIDLSITIRFVVGGDQPRLFPRGSFIGRQLPGLPYCRCREVDSVGPANICHNCVTPRTGLLRKLMPRSPLSRRL